MNEQEYELLISRNDFNRAKYYSDNINILAKTSYIFFDCGKSNVIMYKKMKKYDIAVLPLADYSHMFILDRNTYNKNILIKVQPELFLDSNVIINNVKDGINKYQYDNLFADIKENNISASCFPYIIESVCKSQLSENKIKNMQNLIRGFFERIYTSNDAITTKMNETNTMLLEICNDFEFKESINEKVLVSYLYFLKIFILLFRYKDADKATEEFVNSINNDIFMYLDMPFTLCIDYLLNRKKSKYFKFFKKLQLNNKRILEDVNGMSWDITLYYILLRENIKNALKRDCIALPYFLTCDQGLTEVIIHKNVRSMSIVNGEVSNMIFNEGIIDLKIKNEYKQMISNNNNYRKNKFNREKLFILKKKYEYEVLSMVIQ